MAARQNRPQRNRQPRNNRWMQNTSRSFLLEDFRENRYPNLQLNEIVSHVVEFATDHDGSKFIQRKMDDATENRKEAIFREMRPQMPILMKDTFANFVVQKFFDVGNESQKMELLKLIRDEFMVLSVHKYGCRVVQKAIEKSATIHQTYILMHPQHDYVQLARNANGNHVLQKCFRCVNMILKDHLYSALKHQIFDLCFDLYGCRVIQCILVNSVVHRTDIFKEICRNGEQIIRLIQDRYANYVISHAIEYCAPSDQHHLIEYVVRNVILLSQQKYASNVVERSLNRATPSMVRMALLTVCTRSADDVLSLCTDAYANYVIQKLIDLGDVDLVRSLYERAKPNFKTMRRHVCGRKIIEQLEQKVCSQ